MNAPVNFQRPGVWKQLLVPALQLMSHLEAEVNNPQWTFGGGTVLMLRIYHRFSKDIDLFVPDPQMLGYINPRLSDAAESLTHKYSENAEFIKLFMPDGEIDVVVGKPLTDTPFDVVPLGQRTIRIETCAEIIAKKMWHRGASGKARDLFDLCAVAEAEPEAIEKAAPFLSRHAAAFVRRLHEKADVAKVEFDAISKLNFNRSFEECLQRAEIILSKYMTTDQRDAPAKPSTPNSRRRRPG
jgi:hypothetical protein